MAIRGLGVLTATGQHDHEIHLWHLDAGIIRERLADLQALAVFGGGRLCVARVECARRVVIERLGEHGLCIHIGRIGFGAFLDQ